MPAGVNAGDTAWMLAATALVLLMTPALGLFYAGLVRAKNTLNTFMMCVAALAVATIAWALIGYSLAFDGDGLDRRARPRVPAAAWRSSRARARTSRSCCSWPSRRRSASSPPRWSPARWSSACASGRSSCSPALWSVLVYAVLAHWAFGGGWLQAQGTLDFAGGVPVEMGSGFSALAAALVVGARKDYGRQALLPHNSVYVLLGAGLLWFGWFGFNGGSGFSAGNAGRARVRQHAARARRARWPPGSCSTWSARGRSRRSAPRPRSSSAAWASRRPRASSARCGRWRSASSPRCRATR